MDNFTIDTKDTNNSNEPWATVLGQPLGELPRDLYVPSNALKVILGVFTGPLDLLLYLIRRDNINILDIPIAQITAQYMEYITLMKNFNLDLAAEYLVMAAMLAEIKSKMLLPKPVVSDETEEDPRAELVRKLREYEQFKKVAIEFDMLPRIDRDIFTTPVYANVGNITRPLPKLELQELFIAFKRVMERISIRERYEIVREGLSIRERMANVLSSLRQLKFVTFESMLTSAEGKPGAVITFIAILELLRQNLVDIVQAEAYGSIYLNLKGPVECVGD